MGSTSKRSLVALCPRGTSCARLSHPDPANQVLNQSHMTRAPIGAVIEYWTRPVGDRERIHRIEVEHALHMAAASQDQVRGVLTSLLQVQTESLRATVGGLSAVSDGLWSVAEGLGSLDDTLRQGLYQLHLDECATHQRLDDLLLLIFDKEGYRRELATRQAAAEERRLLHVVSGQYSDAMTLTKRALNERDVAKASAMLDEAVVLLGRASRHTDFATHAHFQLGYLAQQHKQDFGGAYSHYEKALGPTFSPHYVRTVRHLAHLDYLSGDANKALDRMRYLVEYDAEITAFARDLAAARELPWEQNACILALRSALESNRPLLSRCANLALVLRQFDDQRSFSATECFMESYSVIESELRSLRPDLRTYFDAARYAAACGLSALAVSWLKHCLDGQTSLAARRLFLIEALADEDLRHG